MSFQPSQGLRRNGMLVAALVISLTTIGCTTREVVDRLGGSTAQRLVTYSLDEFIEALIAQPEIVAMAGKTVRLDVHFLQEHPLLDYSERLIDTQLQLTHGIRVARRGESPAAELDVFFNSIGTDSDDFGLSVPALGLVGGAESINILALDMYHGITEGYAIVRSEADGSIQKTEKVLARVRRDNVSTPVIDFPINQLD